MIVPRAPSSTRRQATGILGLAGWVMFDWAAQPYYTLVLTFLFAPYFVSGFIGDPIYGQTLWAYLIAASGVMVAFGGPLLGAIADASGRRKPWIAVFSLGLITGLSGLWLAEPGGDALIVVSVAFLLAAVSAECTTIFTNAMMPSLVSPDKLGRLSGIGWATGYAGGLVSLVLVAGLLTAEAGTGKTMLGLEPLLTLNAGAREAERIVGPFSALWYLVFVLPLFMFTPDISKPVTGRGAAISQGLKQLKDTLLQLRRYAGLLRFLLARMLYADGLGAIFAFGGLYAASIFGWGATQLGLFGIMLTLAGAVGALAGGWLDDRRGARFIIMLSLVGLIAASLGIVSIDKNHVLFFLDISPAETGSTAFSSTGEKVYLFFAAVVGLLAGPLQASSRSYLARRAPPDMMTEFFGLFAFSGKVTAFAAPLLVGLVTSISGSQRWGIAVVLLFLGGGFVLILGTGDEP